MRNRTEILARKLYYEGAYEELCMVADLLKGVCNSFDSNIIARKNKLRSLIAELSWVLEDEQSNTDGNQPQ